MVGGKKTNTCKLARWSGSLWTYEVFDNAYCACVSLAFKGDFPAVAYNDIVGGGIAINTLKYAEKKLVGTSVVWVKEVVASGNGSTGSVCDLEIAPNGSPAIVHNPGGLIHPVFTQKSESAWISEDIEVCGYCGYNPEFVFHGTTPWVSYVNDTPEEPGLYRVVKAAYRDAAGQWIVERVESDPVNLNAWHSSIAFPPGGDQPGVAHMFPSYALRFARRAPLAP